MSHPRHALLVTLLVIGFVAMAILVVVGAIMLRLNKQPARRKGLRDRLDSFLTAADRGIKKPKHFWLIFCTTILTGIATMFYYSKQNGDWEGFFWELAGIASLIIITAVLYVLNIVLFEPIARHFRKQRREKNRKQDLS